MADDLADACASSIGGVITVAVTYPIEIVKNRMASSSSSSSVTGTRRSAADVARDIVESAGFLGFYEGVTLSAVENGVEKFMYFYTYSALRRMLQALRGGPSMIVDLAAGSLAEIAHLPLSIPLETILVKIVNNPGKGALALIRDTVLEKGLSALYAGTVASAVLSLKPAIQLATFEAIKSRLLSRREGKAATALSTGQAFLLGAIARAFATILVFPVIRAKFMAKNMKGQSNGDAKAGGGGFLDVIAGLYRAMELVVRQSGVADLYCGLPQELARATTSAALLMAVRERLTLVIKQLLIGGRNLQDAAGLQLP
eukprot:CAMPEP_0183559386 /NCGR_PEP_ID=MMETSP0371-20130417/91556_1 /TAXON_ID=268820 /ORGANISM="Peridinium aciculiferum, Strain PAER-2" /LENGTH=313 /DNA_ID=CAMNT_0025767185 /DNA_START=8 /DNA_END=947 /DNA_ORIENTATION=-